MTTNFALKECLVADFFLLCHKITLRCYIFFESLKNIYPNNHEGCLPHKTIICAWFSEQLPLTINKETHKMGVCWKWRYSHLRRGYLTSVTFMAIKLKERERGRGRLLHSFTVKSLTTLSSSSLMCFGHFTVFIFNTALAATQSEIKV